MFGIDFLDKVGSEVGIPLVKEGIKFVTGIDLDAKELTPEDKQKILDNEFKIKSLDFDELKLKLESKLEEKRINNEHEQKAEENITNRWTSDNNADSRFAKLLRPALTAYLVFIVTILSILDGNIQGFNIKDVWVTLFTSLCMTAVGGYFVLRTYEKRTGTSVWKK